ncbi:Octanoate-[acyl-carrier-protein]-protein-N-octanoyltransferase [hydrothermal vent metagenome]|uniref:lipoyl(octanoyl) transferase n=1 Tax=hydrothermal vent metagenome TaxID=652676 RepID=A0A3B0X7S7_9ZZZZ
MSTLLSNVVVRELGVQAYSRVLKQMQQFNAERGENTTDEIWLLQHPCVFTLGTNSKPEHLLNPEGIPVVQSDRGGQVTCHAPGQLIVYLLLDVRRKKIGVRTLVSALEESVIQFLAKQGVVSVAQPEAPGVYVKGEKIAALGLRVKQGGCYHGLSLNVDIELSDFDRINPCGYPGMKVTSLQRLGVALDVRQSGELILKELCQQLNLNPIKAEA